jgi:hypothetical protein
MDRLWKLPPSELSPAPDGGWAVQSEQGLGRAQAAFVPVRAASGAWELAMAPGDVLPLTGVDDQHWTPVPFPPGMQDATHGLCLLRYDHPWNRPGNNFFVPESLVPDLQASRDEVQQALDGVRANLEGPLEIHLVPLPAPPRPHGVMAFAKAAAPAAPDSLCFAFASCQYPAGMLDRPVAHQSLGRLATWLDAHPGPQPERLLLLGDQVYVDATYGLLDPTRIDDRYTLPYEEFTNRRDGPFAALSQTFLGSRRMTLDDHEIRDNWEPTLPVGQDEERDAGVAAYWKYQRRSAPPPSNAVQFQEEGPGWRLFMANSRSEREFRDENTLAHATILGQRQTQELEDWLGQEDRGELKIVTCASMVLPRTRVYMDEPLYLDPWQGYPASLHRLLAFLCEHELRNVVILGGDAHLACDARVKVTRDGREVRFAALHAPALYAPYPFANEEPANLLLQDHFTFTIGGQEYACDVRARVLAGGRNGCGLLRAERQGSQWCVGYEVLEPEPVA